MTSDQTPDPADVALDDEDETTLSADPSEVGSVGPTLTASSLDADRPPPEQRKTMIELDRLTKEFETAEGRVTAVDRVSMEVKEGEICILLGPSGCGKTTTLKMVNRLIAPTGGRIVIDGEDAADLDDVELRRRIGYVIQQIGLFPNMTVAENIAIVPRLLGWPKARQEARAAEMLDLVALDPKQYLSRYPRELSGGQQQRVGVARALAADPPVLLMDEPFGAIDPINREVIQDEFLKLQRSLNKTVMFVSHDIDEAVKMGDKVAIFRAGRLIQYASPDKVLAEPINDFIRDFVGADRTLKRLQLVTVADALLPEKVYVTREDKMERAVSLMEELGFRSLAVCSSSGKPRGYITLNDARENPKALVGDHTQIPPAAAHLREDLRTCLSKMFTFDRTWLAVIDDDKQFQGYLTMKSITSVLGEVRS